MSLSRSTRLDLLVASFSIVPFYCTPFIISLYIQDFSNTDSSIIFLPSIMMLSQLALVLLLPALSVQFELQRVFSLIFFSSFCVLFASFFLEISEFYLSLCAFFIGLSSGSLFSFGTTISLNASDKTIAFLSRLAYTLVLTGLVSTTLILLQEDFGLQSILVPISIIYFIFFFYIRGKKITFTNAKDPVQNIRLPELLPLLLVVLFYMSQSGFYVFHASFYNDDFASTVLLAGSRLAAGVAIILLPIAIFTNHSWRILIIWLAMEVISIFLLYQSLNLLLICFVIVAYEVSLNSLAAFSQANAGALAHNLAHKYLAPSIIVGAALGPIFFSYGAELVGVGSILSITIVLAIVSVLTLKIVARQKAMMSDVSSR